MLRQNSTEVPSSFTPQWLQNRAAAAAQAQPSSPTAAARREEKPWVAERWSTDKEPDSKWNHDPAFDRARAWAEDERDRERLVGGPRRDPGRRKPTEWGTGVTTPTREPFAQDRWGDSSLRDPLREPSRADRWRADEKLDKWGSRGDRLDLPESQPRDRWRAPGAQRLDERGFGDRGGITRDEFRGAGDERLGPPKGRGFGFGRGRGAGAPLAPGAAGGFESWGSKDLDGIGSSGYNRALGDMRPGSSKRRPSQVYTVQHLEDLKDMMMYKLKVDELPLPRGLTVDTLGEMYRGFVEEEEEEPQPEWANEPVHPPGEAAAAEPAAAAPAQQPAAAGPPPASASAVPPIPPMPVLPPGMPYEALDADLWIYRDPQGVEQGPFGKPDILDWLEGGFFQLNLPIRSALPGQEQVWSVLEVMIVVWAQAGARKVQLEEAAAAAQQQGDSAPVVDLSKLSSVDLPQYKEPAAYSATGVDAWLNQQQQQQEPRQQQQQVATVGADLPKVPEQQQQQQHAGGFVGYPGGPMLPPQPFGAHLPHLGPGHLPGLAAAAAPAAAGLDRLGAPAWGAPAAAAHFGQQQHAGPTGLPASSAGIAAVAPAQAPLFGAPGPLAAPAAAPAQIPPQQRTLFGTPLEAPPQPAAAAAATPAGPSSTGSKMLDLLFNRRPSDSQQQQQPAVVQAPAAARAPAVATGWGQPPAAAVAAAAEPEPDTSNWETVPTKAEKQQVRQTQQNNRQQQAWQQPEPPAAVAAHADADLARAPSGPIAVPLFPQAAKAEPPKPAPWAAVAPAAATVPQAKSLREIQEEEQARAAAAEEARAEEAAQAAGAAAAAASAAVPAAAAAGAWGRTGSGGAIGAGVPPGWGPTPAAAAVAPAAAAASKKQEAPRVASTDELPAPVKKATLGDILAARLGSSGRTASNASSVSAAGAAAAGPWGSAAAAARPAVSLNHIMQQEAVDREETVMDLEGGSLKEEGLEDLIAALRQRNSAGQRQQQQQQQPAAAAAGGEDGLFWDYTGANAVNSNAVKPTPAPAAVPVPLPRAAVAAAAAAAQPRLAAPTAAAPPALATPWARAAASGAASLKAPPPGSQPAAAPSSKPSAAAVVGRGANQPAAPPRAAAGSGVPGAIYQEPAPAPRRQAAAAPVPAAAPAANNSSEPVLFGGLELSPAFAQWCKGQMQQLNGNDDMTMVEFLMGLTSNSEIAEYCQMVWPNKPGVSTFVSEFVKRKVAEQNRKPGGKKKKGGNAAAAVAAPAANSSGVSAAAVGLVHAGSGSDSWSKIPKKAGSKKKKGAKLDPSMLGFTSKLDLELLQEEDD